jgi:hypothetical protein
MAAGAFVGCDLTNVTICPPLEAGVPTVVAIYNQQGQAKSGIPVRLSVGLPAGVSSWTVLDFSAKSIVAQITAASAEDMHLRTEYYNYSSTVNVAWLNFFASAPAMGYSVYFLVPAAQEKDAPLTHVSTPIMMETGEGLQDQTISNGVVTLTVSGTTGRISNFANAKTGVNVPLVQDFVYYRSSNGTAQDGQASGAYIFRPNASTTFPVSSAAATVVITGNGPIVYEISQIFGSWASQVCTHQLVVFCHTVSLYANTAVR